MKNEKEAMIIVLNLFLNLQMQKRKLNPTKNQNIYIWLYIYLPNLSICTNIYILTKSPYIYYDHIWGKGVVSIIVFYFWFYMYHITFTEEEKLYFVPLESLIGKILEGL